MADRVGRIRHQVLVMSGKGGVGKSTVSVNLARGLLARGFRVGLLDADLHGPTIPLLTGLTGQHPTSMDDSILPLKSPEGLAIMSIGLLLQEADAPVVWRGPLRSSALRQLVADVAWEDLDYLICDLPPGTGDEALTVAGCFPAADGVIIVSTPQEASLSDCRRAIHFVEAVKLPVLGVVENMSGFVCPHCGQETLVFSTGGAERMARDAGVRLLARIPLVPEIVALSDAGRSVLSDEASSAVRDAFVALADAVIAACGEAAHAPAVSK